MVMVIKNPKVRTRRSAFTLLEILLVVGLLALLASFAIPALLRQGEEGKIKLARAATGPNGPIAQAIDLFKFNTGVYPAELKDLIDKPSDDKIAQKWTGPYLNDVSGLQDPWGNEYMYEAEGKHNVGKVDMWSKGADGIDGNDDDILNWKTDK